MFLSWCFIFYFIFLFFAVPLHACWRHPRSLLICMLIEPTSRPDISTRPEDLFAPYCIECVKLIFSDLVFSLFRLELAASYCQVWTVYSVESSTILFRRASKDSTRLEKAWWLTVAGLSCVRKGFHWKKLSSILIVLASGMEPAL